MSRVVRYAAMHNRSFTVLRLARRSLVFQHITGRNRRKWRVFIAKAECRNV